MIDVNYNPSRRDLTVFGLVMIVFAGLLGGLVLYKGSAFLVVAMVLTALWLISLIFNSENRRAQLLGALLPGICAATGGPIMAGAEKMTVAIVVWVVGALVALTVLATTEPARRIYIGWCLAAVPIGWTVTHAILAFTYFLVMTPIGLIMRLCGRDPMHRKFDPNAASYWFEHRQTSDAGQYFRQF